MSKFTGTVNNLTLKKPAQPAAILGYGVDASVVKAQHV